MTISALSLERLPRFTIRVYPPFRPSKFPAMVLKSSLTRAGWRNLEIARRRAARSPRFPRVTIFSARLRAALAFGSVVVMRLHWIRSHTNPAKSDSRCDDVRPNLIVRFLWRITIPLLEQLLVRASSVRTNWFQQIGVKRHSQTQSEVCNLLLNLIQRFLPEISVF